MGSCDLGPCFAECALWAVLKFVDSDTEVYLIVYVVGSDAMKTYLLVGVCFISLNDFPGGEHHLLSNDLLSTTCWQCWASQNTRSIQGVDA